MFFSKIRLKNFFVSHLSTLPDVLLVVFSCFLEKSEYIPGIKSWDQLTSCEINVKYMSDTQWKYYLFALHISDFLGGIVKNKLSKCAWSTLWLEHLCSFCCSVNMKIPVIRVFESKAVTVWESALITYTWNTF